MHARKTAESPSLQPGDIVVMSPEHSKGRPALSRKIVDLLWQKASPAVQGGLTHSAIVVHEGDVVESRAESGVVRKPFAEAVEDKAYVVKRPPLPEHVRERAAAFAERQVGKDYSWSDAILQALGSLPPKKVTEVVGEALDLPKDRKGFSCSSLIAAAYGANKLTNAPGRVTLPADFRFSKRLEEVQRVRKASLPAIGRLSRGVQKTASFSELVLEKVAAVDVRRRFGRLKDELERSGTYVGTGHKRITFSKQHLTAEDLRTLGFVPVKIAVPEQGQVVLESYRHPDNNYHIHDHGENWTMHRDEHPSSTMLIYKLRQKKVTNASDLAHHAIKQLPEKGRQVASSIARVAPEPPGKWQALTAGATTAGKVTAELVRGLPHLIGEGVPEMYYYAKGQVKHAPGMVERVQAELPQDYLKRIRDWKPSPTAQAAEKAAEARPGTPAVLTETLTLSGRPSTVERMKRFLSAAQWLGDVGSSRMLATYVDGDGEDRLKFSGYKKVEGMDEATDRDIVVVGDGGARGERGFQEGTQKLASETVFWTSFCSEVAKAAEAPYHFHPVKVLPPRAKRKEFPFTGYIDFQGIQIDVENLKGSYRCGKDKDGHEWKTLMHAHYGEIRKQEHPGALGVDGDKLDVYVGPNADSSLVVVVHQHDPVTKKFDEDKVLVGFDSEKEAIDLYKKQYDRPGFYVEGDYKAMPIGEFWRWVHDRKNAGKKVAGVGILAQLAGRPPAITPQAAPFPPHAGAANTMRPPPGNPSPPRPFASVVASPWAKKGAVLSEPEERPKVPGMRQPRLATPRLNPDQGKHVPINPFRVNWKKLGSTQADVLKHVADAVHDIPPEVRYGALGALGIGAGAYTLKRTADQAVNPHPEGVGAGAGARTVQKALTLGLSRAGSGPVTY